MHALQSDSPLIVYIDFKSPYAFVAMEPILQLEAELNIAFDWRPLTLDIPSYLGSATKVDGQVVESTRSEQQWLWVKHAYADARRYAAKQGYTLKGTEKIWDSSIANIGLLWVMQEAREALPAYLRSVYPAFWNRALDIEDLAVVENCLRQAGAPSEGFEAFCSGIGLKIHDDLQQQLHPSGIYGVPTFVINDTILFGREHLPYIRWCLTGCKGPAPDIAYEIAAC